MEVVDDARRVAIELRGVLRELVFRGYPLVFAFTFPYTRAHGQLTVWWYTDGSEKSIQRTTPYRAYMVRLLCFAAFSSSRGSYSGASGKSAQNHALRSRVFLCNTLGTWRNEYKMRHVYFQIAESPFLFMFFILSYFILSSMIVVKYDTMISISLFREFVRLITTTCTDRL